MDLQGVKRIVRIAATFATSDSLSCGEHLGWANQLFPGDYLPSYKRAAEQGERKAQYLLGLRYERGWRRARFCCGERIGMRRRRRKECALRHSV